MFISANVENKKKTSIELTSGFMCVLYGVLEKFKAMCIIKIKKIKKNINNLHNDVDTNKYDYANNDSENSN